MNLCQNLVYAHLDYFTGNHQNILKVFSISLERKKGLEFSEYGSLRMLCGGGRLQLPSHHHHLFLGKSLAKQLLTVLTPN